MITDETSKQFLASLRPYCIRIATASLSHQLGGPCADALEYCLRWWYEQEQGGERAEENEEPYSLMRFEMPEDRVAVYNSHLKVYGAWAPFMLGYVVDHNPKREITLLGQRTMMEATVKLCEATISAVKNIAAIQWSRLVEAHPEIDISNRSVRAYNDCADDLIRNDMRASFLIKRFGMVRESLANGSKWIDHKDAMLVTAFDDFQHLLGVAEPTWVKGRSRTWYTQGVAVFGITKFGHPRDAWWIEQKRQARAALPEGYFS